MSTPKISFAPMEGITTYIFRNTFHKYYGGIDTYYSPFLSNTGLSNKEKADICPENNNTLTLIPQVLTNHSEVFLSLANQLKDLGYTEVNLNLGCPSGTVVAKNKGAGCLKDPALLEKLLDEIFEKSPVEVSLKTRIGMQDLAEWDSLLRVYQKFPLKELTIHPRLQKEFYKGSIHREAYEKASQTLHCPLCYNGDLVSVESYQSLREAFPNTNHIMIGRGFLSCPPLAESILSIEAESDKPNSSTSLARPAASLTLEALTQFQRFHDEILDRYVEYMSGDTPVLFKMKELWAYFTDYCPLSDQEKKQLRKCNSVRAYRLLMQNHFRSLC